jgi:hypothetical protein
MRRREGNGGSAIAFFASPQGKTIDLYRRGAEGVKKFLDEISENRSGIGGDATLRLIPNPKN